jgi:putative Holliday junction resolvase
MARILGIDYGTKRTGLSATDPLQIIVSGIDTISTAEIFTYLKTYMKTEEVEKIVIGEPFYPDGNPAQIHHLVVGFSRKLQKIYPDIEVVLHDERFTSEAAKTVIFNSGAKQKKRRDKGLVDKISAVLILQDYLGHI